LRALLRTVVLAILLVAFVAYVWHNDHSDDWHVDSSRASAQTEPTDRPTFHHPAPEHTIPVWEPEPLDTATATLTPIIVPPEPTVVDVFQAATRVIEATQQAERVGTAPPLPPNLITATFTPPPFIVVNTPTPENEATATYQALLARAIAVTTGTPTPLPENRVTATPWLSPTPPILAPDFEARATPAPTMTPVLIPLDDQDALRRVVWPSPTAAPTPTAIPHELLGKIAFKSDLFGYQRILVVDPDGRNPALLTNSWAYDVSVERERLSPDGRYIVHQAYGRHGLDLFISPVEGGTRRQLTFIGQGVAYDPAWAPDGRSIVFSSNQEGHDDLFIVSFGDARWPDPHTTKLTTREGSESFKHPSYSPDGRQIVFYSNKTGKYQLWIVNVDGSNQRLLFESSASCWDPAWLK
jgi:hypothetical protein